MSVKKLKWLSALTGGRCAYCGVEFTEVNFMTVDHLVSRRKGGTDERGNKLPCCSSCNATKGHRPLNYLREALQRRAYGRPKFTQDQFDYLTANGWCLPEETPFQFYWEVLGNTFPDDANG
jgi:5-methylcytosine-specific restriction endonuclease McrA